MIDLLWFLVGLAILVLGGQGLVRGAGALAARLGVQPVVIGMTVVAFGTSTPELVVNLAAAARGDSAIGFGNVVGSNIANVGLLLAVTALGWPLVVHRSIITREIPMLVLACGAGCVLGMDHLLAAGPDRFNRGDGLVLLLLFAVFLYYTLADALGQRSALETAPAPGDTSETTSRAATGIGTWATAGCIVGGLLLLIAGGQLTVRGATGLAAALGVPEVIVGLTLVAVGTSLPELATSVLAARRGATDLAVGNIVGSNLFNLLFIWGLTTTIAPTDLPVGGRIDLFVMTALALILLPLALSQRRLARGEGVVLLLAYAGYIGCLALR